MQTFREYINESGAESYVLIGSKMNPVRAYKESEAADKFAATYKPSVKFSSKAKRILTGGKLESIEGGVIWVGTLTIEDETHKVNQSIQVAAKRLCGKDVHGDWMPLEDL